LRTLIIVKPDWAKNDDLISELFCLIKWHGLVVLFSKGAILERTFWSEFYADHVRTSYFEEMVQWMSSSSSLFVVVEGERAVGLVRWKIVGRNGSGLRAKYQVSELKNVAHASDSESSAIREIELVYRSLK